MLPVVGADVAELEALGQRVVELDGAELPGTADGVGDLELQLRAIEGSLAGIDVVVDAILLQGVLETALGVVPI